MSNEDGTPTDVVYVTPEELQADTAFLVGQAYQLLMRVQRGENNPKLAHAIDRFLRDCRAYHRKLYKDQGNE